MDALTRRDFIGFAPALLLAPRLWSRADLPIRLIMVYAPDFERARRAAEMSAAEAERAAGLLERDFEFAAVPFAQWSAAERAPTGIIVATRAPVPVTNVPMVDIANVMPCGAPVLKLTPPADRPLHVWHASLERYGAAQLNDRFKAAGITADDQAWLGWFAVKLLWESAVRGRAPGAGTYDGHKGVPLRFNAAGVLVQPLYEVKDGETREVRPDATSPAAGCA